MRTFNQVILFVIDDLRADQFNHLLSEGKLPNMKEYLSEGIKSNSTACYPAITYPAQSTMLTGLYPDSYEIPGGHWVKRDEKVIRNYNSFKEFNTVNKELGDQVKTIFELITGRTSTLSTGLTRGASCIFPRKWQIINLYIWYMLLQRKQLIYLNTLLLNKMQKQFNAAEPPRLTVCWFISTDNFLHNHGSNSEFYIQGLRDIDEKIGQFINGTKKWKGLKNLGYFDDTAIILTSDHGNFQAKQWVDISSYLDQIGLIPLIPKKQDGNFDATMGSVCFFNLRGDTWIERPTIEQLRCYGPHKIDLLEALLKIPGAKYLYYRNDGNKSEEGSIHIIKKEESTTFSAIIEYQNDKTRLVSNSDLYGYAKDEISAKMLDGKFHSIDEWLAHTHHIDFPMIVDQIARLFRNPNSCDIVISTCGNTIFNYEHGFTKNDHIFGHDIGLRSAITVPLLISNPYIPEEQLSCSKSTDIVPTILKLLGEPIPPQLVGKCLV